MNDAVRRVIHAGRVYAERIDRDPNWRKDVWIVGTIVVVVMALWVAGYSTAYFNSPDALDYAQMGRAVHDGNGFATAQILPRHVPYFADHGFLSSEHWPNLYRYPLTPLFNAFLQALVHDPATAAIVQSGVFFLFTVLASYFLARRFGGRWMSLFAVSALLAYTPLWDASYNGMTETLAAAMIVAVFVVLARGNGDLSSCFLVGVFCGLAFLARTQLAILLPVALVAQAYFLRVENRPVWLALFVVVGVAAVILPWGLRNEALVGEFMFSFSSSRNLVLGTSAFHSDIEMQLHAPVGTAEVLRMYGNAIVAKFLGNLAAIQDPTALVHHSGVLFALVLVTVVAAVLGRRDSPRRQVLRFALWVCLVLNFLVVSLAFARARFFLPFVPLIVVFGVADLSSVAARVLQERRRPWWVPLSFVVALGFLGKSAMVAAENRYMRVNGVGNTSGVYAELSSWVPASALIASDVSHEICFVLPNRALRLPAFPEDLYEIQARYLPVSYLVLSPRITQGEARQRDASLFEDYQAYRAHIASPRFQAAFEPVAVLSNGAVLFRSRR